MGLFSREPREETGETGEPAGRSARVSGRPRSEWETWERGAARWVPDDDPAAEPPPSTGAR